MRAQSWSERSTRRLRAQKRQIAVPEGGSEKGSERKVTYAGSDFDFE